MTSPLPESTKCRASRLAVDRLKALIRYTLLSGMGKASRMLRAVPSERRWNLVVVCPMAIGDFVLFSSILESLRNAGKTSSLLVIGAPVIQGLAEASPAIDRFVPVDFHRLRRNPAYAFRELRSLSRIHAETVLLPNFSRSAEGDQVVASVAAPRKIGFRGDLSSFSSEFFRSSGEKFYTDLIETAASMEFTELDYYAAAAARFLGVDVAPGARKIWISDADRTVAAGFLEDIRSGHPGSEVVVIHAGANHKIREWPENAFRELATRLLARGCRVVFVGGEGERAATAKIIGNLDVKNLTGRLTLPQIGALARQADCYIGNDSGPLHIAMAAGARTVGIRGGGSGSRFVSQTEEQSQRVAANVLPCYHCSWVCKFSEPICITGITVDAVFAEFESAMREPRPHV